ncbi:MAG: hypothetical protein ACOC3V_01035 [bacterium]
MNLINLSNKGKKRLEEMLSILFPEYYCSIKQRGQLVVFKKNKWSIFAKNKVSVMELCLNDIPKRILKQAKTSEEYERIISKLDSHYLLDIILDSDNYKTSLDVIDYLYEEFKSVIGYYTQDNIVKVEKDDKIFVRNLFNFSHFQKEFFKNVKERDFIKDKKIIKIPSIKINVSLNIPKLSNLSFSSQ